MKETCFSKKKKKKRKKRKKKETSVKRADIRL